MSNFKKPIIKQELLESFKVRISQIPPFDVAFKEMALTDYEMLVATIYRLNELIEINQEYIDLTVDVLEWVMNDGLSEAVLMRLSEWRDDGTLDNIINELLFKSKLDKTEFEDFKIQLNQTLENLETDLTQDMNNLDNKLTQDMENLEVDLNQNMVNLETDLTQDMTNLETDLTQDITDFKGDISRDLKKIPKTNIDISSVFNFAFLTSDNDGYATQQGYHYFKNHHIVSLIPVETKQRKGNMVRLLKINSSGTIIATKDIKAYHSNSITHRNNDLYITHLYDYKNGTVNDFIKTISVVDGDTLNIKETKTLDVITRAITYNANKDVFYVMGNEYNKIYEYSPNFSLNKIINIENPIIDTARVQSMQYFDGKLYVSVFRPNYIVVFNTDTWEIESIINIPFFIENKYISLEIEDITTDGENILFTTTGAIDHTGNLKQTLINKFNPYKNVVSKKLYEDYTSFSPTKLIFVDINNNSLNRDGSENRPFKYIQEAIIYVQSPSMFGASIRIKNGVYPPTLFDRIQHNFSLIAVDGDVTIKGLRVDNCQTVLIRDIKINGLYQTNKSFLAYYSNIVFERCEFDDNVVLFNNTDIYLKTMSSNVPNVNFELNGARVYGSKVNSLNNVNVFDSSFSSIPITLFQGDTNVDVGVGGKSLTTKLRIERFNYLKFKIYYSEQVKYFLVPTSDELNGVINISKFSGNNMYMLELRYNVTENYKMNFDPQINKISGSTPNVKILKIEGVM